jgi:Ser/Thr protein kinase RdoA (MazF antagonist)
LDIPGAGIAEALRQLHAAYAAIGSELRANLPSYMTELESVSEVLRDPGRLSALPEGGRQLLRDAFDRLRTRMRMLSPDDTHVVIHGSPHPYNILTVGGEPRFIDFETTCIGPLEWDLAHTSADTARHYAGIANARLLQLCKDMVSVKTATWCWADVNRGDLRYHAEVHLARVKEVFAEDA